MVFRRLLPSPYPHLDWIQVEVTSQCNAACIYCPRTAYRENWQTRHFPFGLFEKLRPALPKTKMLYLQGWGEPFMHPRFFEMLHMAKAAGCVVGTTTNGTLLNEALIERLVDEGLDIIGLSLAGIDEANDRIRKGTRLRDVLRAIERIQSEKERQGSRLPRIHIAYMLMRSRLCDLDRLSGFLGNTGASQVVISSLSLVVSREMEEEATLAKDEEEYRELRNRLTALRETCAGKGVPVFFHLVSPVVKVFACPENSGRALVVGSDGRVHPCVMSQIPAKGENFYYFRGKRQRLRSLHFGNIGNEPLNRIWHGKLYKRFLREYLGSRPPLICRNCLKQSVDTLSA